MHIVMMFLFNLIKLFVLSCTNLSSTYNRFSIYYKEFKYPGYLSTNLTIYQLSIVQLSCSYYKEIYRYLRMLRL